MLISFTGEVTDSKAALSGDSWIVRLKDLAGEMITINCKHPALKEAARMLVIGQMVEVVGAGTRGASSTSVLPFTMFAKNGGRAGDINKLANEFLASLVSGENAMDKKTIESQKVSIQRLQQTLDATVLDYQASQATARDGAEEIERLRKSLEELDRDLQYERTVNGALP